jgi:hypothetical protein
MDVGPARRPAIAFLAALFALACADVALMGIAGRRPPPHGSESRATRSTERPVALAGRVVMVRP